MNIALINELSLIFDKLKISTSEVLEAASTKWNFLPFKPGLVGGHCIGVDPYYLTHKAIEVGHHPEMILAGRKINDNMGNFIADKAISKLVEQGINPINANVAILGLSFKENCPDLRNSKVITIVDRLKHYNCSVTVSDPYALSSEAQNQFGIKIENLNTILNQDIIIIAVAHKEYESISKSKWKQMCRPGSFVIDIKSLYKKEYFQKINLNHWAL